ncbi:MAG: hypothetical protein ACREUD_06105 [Gammaproteobacteria bacterium]
MNIAIAINSCTQGQGSAQVDRPFGEPCDSGVRWLMPLAILAMCVDEDIRVDANHAPRPS